MFPYAVETFTADEEDILRRYVTNLDQPVFALVNLPEVVKGALFARYSRSPKSLRRLFLDEFVGELDISGDATVDATVGLKRAEELYEKVFFEYGDDSVAQLGGVHLACEQASNVLTKVLEWGRLMAYLEQSTRYIAYNHRLTTGHYRYYRDPGLLDSPLGARYVGDMDRMFDTYGELLEEAQAWLAVRHPRQPGDSDFVHRQAVRAKALDALRGLLPAASLSNVGIYGTGQSYEMLLLRMRSHPLPEARALRRPDAGGAAQGHPVLPASGWTGPTGAARGRATWSGPGSRPGRWWASSSPTWWRRPSTRRAGPRGSPRSTLLDFDPDGRGQGGRRHLRPPHRPARGRGAAAGRPARGRGEAGRCCGPTSGTGPTVGTGPGRAFERTDYRFDVVTDYGAFRDLQRHRMLTIEWQPLGTTLGYDVPEVVEEAGLTERLRGLARAVPPAGRGAGAHAFPVESAYAVALAYRIRYSMQMNAREAMHLLELRSGPQGHAELPLGGPGDAPADRRAGRPPPAGRGHVARRLRRRGPRATGVRASGRGASGIRCRRQEIP